MSNLAVRPTGADSSVERPLWRPAERDDSAPPAEFEPFLRDRIDSRRAPPFVSLGDQLLANAAPQASVGQILSSPRYAALLEELASIYAARSAEMDDIGRMGALLLRNEIRKHKLLRQQRNGLIAP